MSQLRLNPLTGRWVTVAVERAARPGELISRQLPVESDPSRPCPFCPGNEEATPPALETYGPSGNWLVRVVPNLFPAFEGDEPLARAEPRAGVHPGAGQRHPRGARVQPRATPAAGPTSTTSTPAWSWPPSATAWRTTPAAPTVRYTQAIVNHGREAGASLEHPHGQLLGIPFVPGEIAEEEAGFRRFGESCLLCTMAEAELQAGHRVVLDDERVAGGLPVLERHALRDARHAPHPRGATSRPRPTRRRRRRRPRHPRRAGAAAATVGDVAYNLVFHTAPHHHDGAVPLARPHRAAAHQPGRLRAGHRRDDQHRRPRARRPDTSPRRTDPAGC